MKNPKNKKRKIHGNIKRNPDRPCRDPETIAKCYLEKLGIFAAFTEELRQDSRYLPVHELYQIYRKTGYTIIMFHAGR